MPVSSLEANKALVLAHYDAVTNRHDPDAIRSQIASDFFDHAANAAMTAETVAAPQGVVLPYKVTNKRPVQVKATLKMPRQRQAIAAAR